MFQFATTQLLVGALALLLVVLAVRTVLEYRKEQSAPYRKEQSAPFRLHVGSGYRRELLQHSELSEGDDWRVERGTRFTPFLLRDPNAIQPRAKVISRTQQHSGLGTRES